MAELIPSNVQNVFARVYHESRTVSPTQRVVAVESHAGHGCRGTCRFRAMLARRRCGSSAKWECYRCCQRGHIARNCMAPSPVTSRGEQGHSSAARQQRPPHKGNNRGHRGAGRGGSSEGSESSRSTSAQQQHQASNNNPGSSGSGSGGAAPWTVSPSGRGKPSPERVSAQ